MFIIFDATDTTCFSEKKATCLYDEPPKATAIRRPLPGKLMSVDEQCAKVFGGGACNVSA